MKYNTIIIDANNLYTRNYSVYKKQVFKNRHGETLLTGAIYGFLRSIQKIERELLLEGGTLYIVFDNAHSQDKLRKEIDPAYKSNRKKKDPIFYKNLETLQYLLLNYKDNYKIVYRSFYEADDLVKPIILNSSSEDFTLLVSEDQDWARLIDYDNRVIHWYAKDTVFDKETYKEHYQYTPTESNITMWKTFRGDDSDHIPVGVEGIRSSTLFQLMHDFKDVFDILQNIDSINYLTSIIREKIVANKARLRLNHQLVSFTTIGKEEIKQFIYTCEWNKNVLEVIYKSLGFDIVDIDKRYSIDAPTATMTTDPDEFFKAIPIKRL